MPQHPNQDNLTPIVSRSPPRRDQLASPHHRSGITLNKPSRPPLRQNTTTPGLGVREGTGSSSGSGSLPPPPYQSNVTGSGRTPGGTSGSLGLDIEEVDLSLTAALQEAVMDSGIANGNIGAGVGVGMGMNGMGNRSQGGSLSSLNDEGFQDAGGGNNVRTNEPNPTDSISLGQLKSLVSQFPRTKLTLYDFRYDSSDTTMNELSEFYSYVDVSQVLEGSDPFEQAWSEICDEGWPKAPIHIKKNLINHLLEQLEHRDVETRTEAARKLVYISQGTFAHATLGPDEHLSLIVKNVSLLRECGALEAVYNALKVAQARWSFVTAIADAESGTAQPGQFTLTSSERQEVLEEINGEISIHLGILYFMVEILRGDETWGEELMNLDPPMPIYLFGLVAALREKPAKGYPVKKLLLLLWKSMLSTLGGLDDVKRVKSLVRDIENLPPDPKELPPKKGVFTKVSPVDVYQFKNEIGSKYPTYVPPSTPNLYLDRVVAAAAPIPIRPPYPYTNVSASNNDPQSTTNYNGMMNQNGQNGSLPVPGTPAPTPPPSPPPKPKKQQFQTDQSKPFILPFAKANDTPNGGPRLVPKSIEEAGELYLRDLRISTELWQIWKIREDCIADETGTAKAAADMEASSIVSPGGSGHRHNFSAVDAVAKRLSSLSVDSGAEQDEPERDPMDPLNMLIDLEAKTKAEEVGAARQGDKSGQKKLAQKVSDLKRLQRIELIYRSCLPSMQSAVIVLLKLLLAAISATSNSAGMGGMGAAEEDQPQLSFEDTDIARHREITSKAVSAILILFLKWFKTSHIMKFHHFSQLLVDSNCLLLILKMFGLQEVSTMVKTKNEFEDHNFFRYCYRNCSNPAAGRQEEAAVNLASTSNRLPTQHEGMNGDEEVEYITDYSWRNFFTVINFVHVLQKLTKRRVHRILLLVQYKSSAILKRILKVTHPMLQLYVLKVIKSQIPYCGRKWRQSNMKVITAIYLNCRPDLRDEWLTGVDVDGEVEDALALRGLVRHFNNKYYGAFLGHNQRRMSAHGQSAGAGTGPLGDVHPSSPSAHFAGQNGLPGSAPNPFDADVFPPPRPPGPFDHHYRTGYVPDTLMDAYLANYDEMLDDLFYPASSLDGAELVDREDVLAMSNEAWNRFGEILGHGDDISDSESVGSIGYLGGYGADDSQDAWDVTGEQTENSTDWEHMSPEIITALEEERKTGNQPGGSPRSPRPRVGSGPKSPALRPVIPLRDEEDNEEAVEEADGNDRLPPTPRSPGGTPHAGPAVDEVEAVFGE